MKKKEDLNFEKKENNFIESYEKGDWEPVPNVEEEIEFYREVARNTSKKDQRINIRLSSRDLLEIKRKALEEGIPYQTLVSSILHKYVSGRLEEKAN